MSGSNDPPSGTVTSGSREPPSENRTSGSDAPVSRRQVLAAGAAAVAAGTAGCVGDGLGLGEDTPTPELPSIEQRTVQEEKAAVTHILSTVSGTAVWPSFRIVSPGGGGTSIVGVWEGNGQRWQFGPNGGFRFRSSEGQLSGQYRTEGNRLVIQVQTDEGTKTFNYRYSVSGSGDDRVLTLQNAEGERSRFRYAGGGGSGGSEDIIEAISQLRIVPEEGAAATAERQDLKSGASGSGFVVNPNGYIVTNAHVVLANEDPTRMLFGRLAAITKRAVVEEMESRYQIPESKRARAAEIMASKLIGYYSENASIQDVSTDFDVLNGVAGPGEDVQVNSWPATVKKQGTVVEEVNGEPSWSRDVAVVKVNREHLPTVELGDASDLETGDKVFVVGYPGIKIEAFFEERNTALEPTLTTGVVSARRTLKTGISAIQTDAGINSGNSGGPMFDEDGKVVGIATFGPSSADIEQIQFGLPVGIAREFMNELGVENEQGQLDEAYEAALAAYWRGDCATTEEKMETVTNLYPDHPYASEFVRKCETGEAPGGDS